MQRYSSATPKASGSDIRTFAPNPIIGALAILLAVCCVYAFIQVSIGRFVAGDEIAYKSPGREWAQTGRFRAPEMTGYREWNDTRAGVTNPAPPAPSLFAATFGAFVRLIGFGYRQNIAFDALIHVVLSLLTAILAAGFASRRKGRVALMAGLLVLPITTFGRPDELAMSLGLAGLILIRLEAVRLTTDAAAAVMVGLAFAVSPFGGLVAATLLAVCLAQQRVSLLRGLLIVSVGVVAVGAFYFRNLDTTLLQYARSAHRSIGASWLWSLDFGVRYGWRFYAFLASMVAMYASSTTIRQNPRFRINPSFVAGCALAVAAIALLPAKYYYLWMLGPWFAAIASARLWSGSGTPTRWRMALLLTSALALVASWIPMAKDLAVVASLPEAQTLRRNAPIVEAAIPPDAVVIATDFWPVLGNTRRVLGSEASVPMANVDYVILTANGTGTPGVRQKLRPEQEAALSKMFHPILNRINDRPARVFGIRISNSAWGFGPVIFENRRLRQADGTTDH